MRTGLELYEYCVANDFGNGTSKSWSIKHFDVAVEQLMPNEEVLMCFIGLHNYISASKHNNNFAYVLTNQRFIMAQKKAFGENVLIVKLDNLNDITKTKGLLMGVITIDTIKEKFNVRVNGKTIDNIHNELNRILFSIKQESNNVNIQQNNDLEKLKTLKELLDMGAITQEEFDVKKSEILGI